MAFGVRLDGAGERLGERLQRQHADLERQRHDATAEPFDFYSTIGRYKKAIRK